MKNTEYHKDVSSDGFNEAFVINVVSGAKRLKFWAAILERAVSNFGQSFNSGQIDFREVLTFYFPNMS